MESKHTASIGEMLSSGVNWFLGGSKASCAAAEPAQGSIPPGMTPMGMTPMGSTTEVPKVTPANESTANVTAEPAAAATETAANSDNPGGYDTADQSAKRVLTVNTFDGFEFEIRKPLNPQFIVSHNLAMGNSQIQGGNQYTFSTQVMPTKDSMISAKYYDHGIVQIDSVLVNDKVRAEVHGQVTSNPEKHSMQPQITYSGSDFTATFKAWNTHVGCSYFQKVTPNLALGGDGMYITQLRRTQVFTRAKYHDDVNQAVGTYDVTNGAVGCSYYRQVGQRVGLATELDFIPATRDSHFSVGYRADFRQSVLSGMIDSNYVISSSVEAAMGPMRIVFSARLDHPKDSHKFGVGIHVM